MGFLRALSALKSVIVGLAVLGLWARSYFVGDSFRKGSETQYIRVASAAGKTVFTFAHDGGRTRLQGSWGYDRADEPREILRAAKLGDSLWNRLGFGVHREWGHAPSGGRQMIVNVMLPHWAVFLLAIPSAVRWVRRRNKMLEEAATARPEALECPYCGQMFMTVPEICPRCRQLLAQPAYR